MKTIIIATQEKDLMRLYVVHAKDKNQAIDKLYESAKRNGVVNPPTIKWTYAVRSGSDVQFLACLPLRKTG